MCGRPSRSVEIWRHGDSASALRALRETAARCVVACMGGARTCRHLGTDALERGLFVPQGRRGSCAARPPGRPHGRGLLPGRMIRKDRPLVVGHGIPMHAPDGPLQTFEEGGGGPRLLRCERGQSDHHARSPARGPRGAGRVGEPGRTCHGCSRSAPRLRDGAVVGAARRVFWVISASRLR